MTSRGLVALALFLLALAATSGGFAVRAARAAAAYPRDSARLEELLAGQAALRTGVLEARAGLDWSFDAINHAVVVLRGAASEALLLAARGPSYAAAADALSQAADALGREEPALETFKTDLALMRVSARYFPSAVDALLRGGDGKLHALAGACGMYADESLGDSSKRSAIEARSAAVGELRTNMERYEEAPTAEAAQRLEASIPKLESMRASAGDAGRGDLDVLLGHTRVILDRRERLDRSTRALVHSPVDEHLQVARAAYQRAARMESGRLWAMRVVTGELAIAALLMLVVAGFLAQRRHRAER